LSVAIVTLTRFPEIFAALAASVNIHEPLCFQKLAVTSGGAKVDPQWRHFAGPEPFCFARNANLGMMGAWPEDVLLTNDDVQFAAPMLDTLSRICRQNPSIGLLSPQILGDGINNLLARGSTNLGDVEWVESKAYVPFVCVYLPRHALNVVGRLNEEFTGYGGEDEDWCARAQRAGFKLAVTPLAKVYHGFGERAYSSSFLRVMSAEQREQSCQDSMARVRALHA